MGNISSKTVLFPTGYLRGTDFALFTFGECKSSYPEIMNSEILDDRQLAERWNLAGTLDAIAKRFQRLRALPKSNPRHLRAFKIGNQTRYRMVDILEYENRNAKNAVQGVSVRSKRKFSEKTRLLTNPAI